MSDCGQPPRSGEIAASATLPAARAKPQARRARRELTTNSARARAAKYSPKRNQCDGPPNNV